MIRHQITIIPLFVFLFSFFFFPFNEIDINCQYNGKIEIFFFFLNISGTTNFLNLRELKMINLQIPSNTFSIPFKTHQNKIY